MTKISKFVLILSVVFAVSACNEDKPKQVAAMPATSEPVVQVKAQSAPPPQEITYEEWFDSVLSKRISNKMDLIDGHCEGTGLSATTNCYVGELNHVLITFSKDKQTALSMIGDFPKEWKEEVRSMFNDKDSTFKLCYASAPMNPSGARNLIECNVFASQWLNLMVELQTKGKWQPYDKNAANHGD